MEGSGGKSREVKGSGGKSREVKGTQGNFKEALIEAMEEKKLRKCGIEAKFQISEKKKENMEALYKGIFNSFKFVAYFLLKPTFECIDYLT